MNTPTFSEQDERISAYLDGELPPTERAEVERRLADDPAARRLVDQLRGVRETLQAAPAAGFATDLRSSVVAEALRRQNEGRQNEGRQNEGRQNEGRVEVAERLEPEGDFGLPFGEASSRRWIWAGVAAAAAVMIGFWGRPSAPPARPIAKVDRPAVTNASLDQRLLAMQRAMPGLRVVDFNATPQKLQQLLQRVSLQQNGPARLPFDQAAAQRAGVYVEPVADATLAPDQEEQLVYIDADDAQLDRLLAELEKEGEGSTYQVGAEHTSKAVTGRAAPPAADRQNAAPKINAVRINLRFKPRGEGAIATQPGGAHATGAAAPGQRRFVVLRIRVSKAPQ